MALPRGIRGKNDVPCIPYEACVAKTTPSGKPGISVQEHCEHVGAVAAELLQRLPDSAKRLIPDDVTSLVAIHDIGKVSPGFQKRIYRDSKDSLPPELIQRSIAEFETDHAETGEASLVSWLKSRSAHDYGLEKWAEVIGNHHGRRRKPKPDGIESYGGVSWQEERHQLLTHLVEKLGPLPISPPDSAAQVHLVSGLTCVADWIASDEVYFPPEGLPPGTDVHKRATEALDACGWVFPSPEDGMSFQSVFGFDHPNSVQELLTECVKGAGLYILEAPMGMGKTEAALYSAYQLISAGHNSGLYFGLPTRLTSERICERVNGFLENVIGDSTRARLIHGQSWLRAGGEELEPGRAWFNPRKRSLLAPYGVGTIDQALLAIMRVKHHFVRSFGMAGKVVILDEVHSYDVYTGTLLDELIRYLLSIGCSVIILSATLTRERRAKFVPWQRLPDCDAYPLITVASQHDKLEAVDAEPPPSMEVQVGITGRSWPDIAGLALERAEKGQSVLWIVNTVDDSQECYRAVMSERREGGPAVGLLHSRFPSFRRDALESYWMERLGRDGNRDEGCVLVATQVVEQSVDIDADYLITELAPTDMLLQRLGRLWRHKRTNRPCESPEVLVISEKLEKAGDHEALKIALGRSHRVYAPYIMWRTYQVWKDRQRVLIPEQIRMLLEETYGDPLGDEPDYIQELREELEGRRTALREMALGGLAESMPVMDDDERVATRYSTYPQIQALLVREINATGNRAEILLASNERVIGDRDVRDLEATRKIYKNLAPVAQYLVPEIRNPSYLKKHVFEDVAVLTIRENGRLLDQDGGTTSLGYSEKLGVYRIRE